MSDIVLSLSGIDNRPCKITTREIYRNNDYSFLVSHTRTQIKILKIVI